MDGPVLHRPLNAIKGSWGAGVDLGQVTHTPLHLGASQQHNNLRPFAVHSIPQLTDVSLKPRKIHAWRGDGCVFGGREDGGGGRVSEQRWDAFNGLSWIH